MNNAAKIGFGDWLMNRYLSWQVSTKSRYKTHSAFANYLGVEKEDILNWLNYKSEPEDGELLMKLADKLGPDLYVHLRKRPPNVQK